MTLYWHHIPQLPMLLLNLHTVMPARLYFPNRTNNAIQKSIIINKLHFIKHQSIYSVQALPIQSMNSQSTMWKPIWPIYHVLQEKIAKYPGITSGQARSKRARVTASSNIIVYTVEASAHNAYYVMAKIQYMKNIYWWQCLWYLHQ